MNEQLFSKLVQEHQDMLYRVAYTLLHHPEDCRDALQDALMKAWRNIHKLRNPDAFRSWMIRIVVNCAKDALRKRKIQTVELTGDLSAPEAQAEDEDLAAALRQLEESVRLPIALYYMEGLSVEEISHVMHLPQGTIKNRLFRGRKKLAETLTEAQKEAEAWN